MDLEMSTTELLYLVIALILAFTAIILNIFTLLNFRRHVKDSRIGLFSLMIASSVIVDTIGMPILCQF